MKSAVLFLLLCAAANADCTRRDVQMQRQLNRKYENETGITATKWQTRYYRARFRFNVSRKLSLWGWLF